MIPTYLVWSVSLLPASEFLPRLYSLNSSEKVYWIFRVRGQRWETISFNLIAISLKIIPVLLLIVFSLLLIVNIRQAKTIRERLRRRCSSIPSSGNFTRELRTTTMLVFITSCTLVVELPQGLLLIAIGIDPRFLNLYFQLGDFWDLISISSSFITFVMYCSMSQQFRMEMFQLLSSSSSSSKEIQLRTMNKQHKSLFLPHDL